MKYIGMVVKKIKGFPKKWHKKMCPDNLHFPKWKCKRCKHKNPSNCKHVHGFSCLFVLPLWLESFQTSSYAMCFQWSHYNFFLVLLLLQMIQWSAASHSPMLTYSTFWNAMKMQHYSQYILCSKCTYLLVQYYWQYYWQ